LSGEQWDIYQLEREAFLQAGLTEPSEWEGRRWIRWLAIEVYALVIGLPILVTAGPITFLELILAVVLYLGFFTIVVGLAAAGGVREFVQIIKERLRDSWLSKPRRLHRPERGASPLNRVGLHVDRSSSPDEDYFFVRAESVPRLLDLALRWHREKSEYRPSDP